MYGIFGKAWGKLSVIQHASFQTYPGGQTSDPDEQPHPVAVAARADDLRGPASRTSSGATSSTSTARSPTVLSPPGTRPLDAAHPARAVGGGYAQRGRRGNAAQTAADMARRLLQRPEPTREGARQGVAVAIRRASPAGVVALPRATATPGTGTGSPGTGWGSMPRGTTQTRRPATPAKSCRGGCR